MDWREKKKTEQVQKKETKQASENSSASGRVRRSPMKHSGSFQISALNIDCGYSLEPPRRGGSNENTQSMFLSRNKKIMYTPVNPCFTI